MHTSNEEHLGLFADGLDLIIVSLIVDHVDGLLHVSQHQVAVAVVGLHANKSLSVKPNRLRDNYDS